MALNKDEAIAVGRWGEHVYRNIPKSTFALVTWHMCNLASGTCDEPEAAEARFAEEIRAFAEHQIISRAQARRILTAIQAKP